MGWIQRQRGVRQGCPLGPLLFVLAVDALATCTLQACLHGMLKSYQTRSYLEGIPLLQYADDTTFFYGGLGRGSKEPIHSSGFICRLLGIPDKSGQINFCGVWSYSRRKPAMLGGLGDVDREFIHAILGPTLEESQVDKVRMTTSH